MERFPYEKAALEEVPCNLCGSRDSETLSRRGQDGLPLRAVICRYCGLIFINPRMTKEWYDLYYQHEYRTKTIGIGAAARPPNNDRLFGLMETHGRELAVLLKPYFQNSGALIVEVGSSLGGVLAGLKRELGVEVIGIEPSAPEAEYAARRGIKTYCSLIEDIDGKAPGFPPVGAVVCTQSLNHFLDPRFFFEWAYRRLAGDGLLVLEVMNFRHQLKRAGCFRNAVKIDHPHMFVPEVLKAVVKRAGFETVFFSADETKRESELRNLRRALPTVHMTLVARKTSGQPLAAPMENNYRRVRRSVNPFMIYFSYLFSVRLPKFLKSGR